MNKLLFVSTIFLALTFTSNTVLAQQRGNLSEAEKEQLLEQMAKDFEKLELEEEQKEAYKIISIKYANKLKPVKEMSGSRYAKYKKVKTIRDAKNAEMRKLLSKSQYKTYLEIQERRKKAYQEARGK